MKRRLISALVAVTFSCSIISTCLAAQIQPANPILQAIADGNIEQVRTAISNGFDVNASINDLGWTALHAAVMFGKDNIGLLLIENHADIDAQDHSGQTPLCLAVQSGRSYAVDYLINNGANKDIMNNDGENALSIAQRIGLTTISNSLIQAGATPPQPGNASAGMPGNRRGSRRGGNNFQGNNMTGRRGMMQEPDVPAEPIYPDQPVNTDFANTQVTEQEPVDVSLDPNEVKARMQKYPGLEKEVADVADNSRLGMRQWQRTQEDNRPRLVSAIRMQYQAELEFIKKTADAEGAKKTSEAADNLLMTRRERLAKIMREVNDQIDLQERQNRGTTTTSRRGGRTTTGRTTTRSRRGTTTTIPTETQTNINTDTAAQQESKYDPETQSELDIWLNAGVENIRGRIDFMNTMNDMVTSEISSLKPIAEQEKAEKTIAAIDGLLVARQQRFSDMQAELENLQEEETSYDTMTPNTDTTGQTITTPRGRRGR